MIFCWLQFVSVAASPANARGLLLQLQQQLQQQQQLLLLLLLLLLHFCYEREVSVHRRLQARASLSCCLRSAVFAT